VKEAGDIAHPEEDHARLLANVVERGWRRGPDLGRAALRKLVEDRLTRRQAVEQHLPFVGLNAGSGAGFVGPEIDGDSFRSLEDDEAAIQQDEVLAQAFQEQRLSPFQSRSYSASAMAKRMSMSAPGASSAARLPVSQTSSTADNWHSDASQRSRIRRWGARGASVSRFMQSLSAGSRQLIGLEGFGRVPEGVAQFVRFPETILFIRAGKGRDVLHMLNGREGGTSDIWLLCTSHNVLLRRHQLSFSCREHTERDDTQ
jgi:hypothetical protein